MFRVRITGSTLWGPRYSFSVDAGRILSPSPSSLTTRPVVTWQGLSTARSWEIWINNLDTKSVFHRAEKLGSRSYLLPMNLPVGQYGVRVRGQLADGAFTDWSERRVFEVQAPSTKVLGAGYTKVTAPKFTWPAVAGATSYEITVQNSARQTVIRQPEVKGTSYQVTTALSPGMYTVWVRAKGWERILSVWGPGTSLVVKSSPVVSLDNAILRWNNVAGASLTTVAVKRNATSEVVASLRETTATSLPLPPELRPGVYLIESNSHYADGSTSTVRLFEFELFHPAVTLISPTGLSMDQTPFLQWNQMTTASRYTISVTRVGMSQPVYTAETTERFHRVSQVLTNGKYLITVVAQFGDGSRSAPRTNLFDIGPAPVVTRNGTHLRWNSLPAATHYDIWVNHIGLNNRETSQFLRISVHLGTDFELPRLPAGLFRVWVRAVRAEAGQLYNGNWSTALQFSVGVNGSPG